MLCQAKLSLSFFSEYTANRQQSWKLRNNVFAYKKEQIIFPTVKAATRLAEAIPTGSVTYMCCKFHKVMVESHTNLSFLYL